MHWFLCLLLERSFEVSRVFATKSDFDMRSGIFAKHTSACLDYVLHVHAFGADYTLGHFEVFVFGRLDLEFTYLFDLFLLGLLLVSLLLEEEGLLLGKGLRLEHVHHLIERLLRLGLVEVLVVVLKVLKLLVEQVIIVLLILRIKVLMKRIKILSILLLALRVLLSLLRRGVKRAVLVGLVLLLKALFFLTLSRGVIGAPYLLFFF